MNIEKKSFVWNVIGSGISAGSSFVFLLCVTRTVGIAEGGIFSLAFAIAQLLLTVGKYGVRSFQATDVSGEISFATYVITRAFFCIIMVACSAMYVWVSGFELYKAEIVLFVCLLKMVDAVEDVFHGQFQLCDKMYIAGQLLSIRNLFSILLFGISIFITCNLLFTCAVTAIFSLLICLIINGFTVKKCGIKWGRWNIQQGWHLFKLCTPLFAGHFLSLYIYNVPKYAIDKFCTTEMQTYYAIIFMPTFVINIFSEFVFKPMLTGLASLWHQARAKEFERIIIKLVINICVVTTAALGGMYLCGIPVLSFVYHTELKEFRTDLIILIAGGGFSAAVYMLYNVLTSMRMQKIIFVNYLTGAILITVISYYNVWRNGIRGAAVSYLIVEAIMFAFMITVTMRQIWKGEKHVEVNELCK